MTSASCKNRVILSLAVLLSKTTAVSNQTIIIIKMLASEKDLDSDSLTLGA